MQRGRFSTSWIKPLGIRGILTSDARRFTTEQRRETARAAGRPIVHLPSSSICKEDQALAIAQRDGIRQGRHVIAGLIAAREADISRLMQAA